MPEVQRVTHWLASSRTTVTPSTVTWVFMGRTWMYCSATFSLLFTKFPVIWPWDKDGWYTNVVNLFCWYFVEGIKKPKNLPKTYQTSCTNRVLNNKQWRNTFKQFTYNYLAFTCWQCPWRLNIRAWLNRSILRPRQKDKMYISKPSNYEKEHYHKNSAHYSRISHQSSL